MKNDFIKLFSDIEMLKGLCPDYDGEFDPIVIKEKYEMLPKISYPLITLDEITNEDVSKYFDDYGENISYIVNQIEITSEQDDTRTARENVRRIANIIDSYLKGDKYRCFRRIGGLTIAPLKSDNNIQVGYLRYEYNLDIKNNIIYRRY